MGDKGYTLVISVDLSCCRCRKAIQEYLCQIQRKDCNIVAIVYEEKKNTVLVSCPFNPEQLKRKLLCKFPKIINGIDIKEPPKQTEEKPKKNERKDKFMKKCEEEYEEISKCIEKCKKECEEKCMTECEDKFKCKCKSKCKCQCQCNCKCNCKEEEPPTQPPNKSPTGTKLTPMCPQPPQITMVCCARPCPCFVVWSNNYRCCSCGVESWPGWCGPGWGSGPSCGGRPQRGCEPSQLPPIVVESTPSCSIM